MSAAAPLTPPPAIPKADPRRLWQGAAAACVVVAAIFCIVVVGQLLTTLLKDKASNPLVADRLTAMRTELQSAPAAAADALKTKYEAEDRQLRETFWQRRASMLRGTWLLLGGAITLLLSVKAQRQLGKREPQLEAVKRIRASHVDAAARWAVIGAGGMLTALLVTGVVLAQRAGTATLPRVSDAKTDGGTGTSPAATPFPSDEAMLKNWPVFRGWDCGRVPAGEWPEKWNGKSGEGIVWKTEVPLPGQNSPIVWEDRVFLSGATKDKREVFCFDAKTGKLLWRGAVDSGVRTEPPEIEDSVGFAAPTMATDGSRVFAVFTLGDIAAFDFNGKKLWGRHLSVPKDYPYGYAPSLTVWGKGDKCTVIVKHDTGVNEPGNSTIMALDTATGKTVWETKRPVPASWSSPVIARGPGGVQILTSADPWVMGYEADTGKELWRAKLLGHDVAPTMVYADGIAYVANDNGCLAAIKMDGQGDVTKTHVKWKKDEDIQLPDMVSPMLAEGLIFYVHPSGRMFCYDAATGDKVWEEETRFTFAASPVLVGKRIGLLTGKGIWLWLDAGRAYKEVGRNELGEGASASPAFVGGKIFIRSTEEHGDDVVSHLYCIGKK